ncbi:DUF4334 domain-containing protein [Cryptosporangium minutisporangium]|uniref:DUF4334 domain-containing protein n=1 Tax=Cryptosporangium minutisporangium TaxID=113569 RepID=A0ABP6SU89_9ACTN
MLLTDARARFAALRRQTEGVQPDDLDEIWAALPTARVDDVLGTWKGADFATGHPLHQGLIDARWYGKTFVSPMDAKPLMCRDENGRLYSNTALGRGGEASLWEVEFRGEVTATMVYDNQPVFDHFKWVDDRTLMGIMNGKSPLVFHRSRHYYFLLERDS